MPTLSIGNGAGFTPAGGSSANPAVAQTITGSITAAADGDGTIVINNAVGGTSAGVEITGNVGSSTAAIGTVFHTAGSLTLGGDVYVTDFLHNNGDITFSGETAQTITIVDNNRNDDTGTAGLISTEGKLSVENAAGVTFTNIVTLEEGNVSVAGTGGSVATFSDTLTLTKGNVTVGDGSNASTSTFTGDVSFTDGNFTVTADSTATFGGNITGALNTLTGVGLLDVDGTAIISGGTDDDSNSATHNVTTLTTAAATNVATTGKLQLNNTLELGSAASAIAFEDGATLELGITSGTAIDADVGSGLVTAGGTINIVASNLMKNGDQVILVNENSGLNANTDATLEGGRFVDFAVEDIGSDVILTATSKSIPVIARDLSISETKAERLLKVFNNSTNSEFAEFVGGESTDAQAVLVADQTAVQEETLTASVEAISGAANQLATITVDRLASLRTGDAYGLEAEQAATGFATGDGEMNRNMWGKMFFNTASQDSAGDADGYDSDTNGFVIGSDTEVAPNMRAGASLAITRSDVDGKGGGDAKTDIDGYQLTVYGDFTQSDYFIDWQVGASMSNVETLTEVDPLSGVSSSNSEYDTMAYLAKVGLGMPIDMNAGDMGDGARLTPYGSLSFQRITSDQYTLLFPNDPGLNQTVTPDDVDEFTASLGGRYTVAIETESGGMISPQVRGALNYDFIGNTAEATSTYADQTELTVKGVEAEKFGASLGAGITYASDTTSLGFDIDSTLKDGYASYTGALNFRLQF